MCMWPPLVWIPPPCRRAIDAGAPPPEPLVGNGVPLPRGPPRSVEAAALSAARALRVPVAESSVFKAAIFAVRLPIELPTPVIDAAADAIALSRFPATEADAPSTLPDSPPTCRLAREAAEAALGERRE